jgi:hypothetical protein
MPTGDGVCKRKLSNSTSDDGRSKRTRKTTKGDGFEQDKGASQRRIQNADTDYVSEDGGSEEFKPDEDGGDSDTGDYFEINGRFNQMHTRGNLRKQYDKALKVDPTLQQVYGDRGSTTRSLVVREKVLNIPETTDKEVYHLLLNRHFGATSFPMERGNHKVAIINPDDRARHAVINPSPDFNTIGNHKADAMLRKLIEHACEACDVKPFGSSRLVWYRDGNSIHTAHHDPTGGQVQSTVTLIANQRDVLA